MKVVSYRLDTSSKSGLFVTVDEVLRTNVGATTPVCRRTLRLLLDEFWREWPGADMIDPEIPGRHEFFLPGLKVDALSRVRAALRKPYRFGKRTISRNRAGFFTINSPHAFLWHDVALIATMASVKKVGYANKTPQKRKVLELALSGRSTIDTVMGDIDKRMK